MRSIPALFLAVVALMLTFGACDTSNAPADHTVNEGGVYHKPGLKSPNANCTECHGATLRGGEGPSCTSCHGVKW